MYPMRFETIKLPPQSLNIFLNSKFMLEFKIKEQNKTVTFTQSATKQ